VSVAIINYGMGNLRSVVNAFTAMGCAAAIVDHPEDLKAAEMIVLPGVGAFGDGMFNLKAMGWVEALEDEVRRKGKPFLGICLGMQLLATVGLEHGRHEGLNWIPGVSKRVSTGALNLRVPHIGWNDTRFLHTDGLYRGLGESQTFYFVHSYVLAPEDRNVISGLCDYGEEFAASIEVDNIYATQFHPEKSHKAGLAILKNFMAIRKLVTC
jgi:imidazole glycerol-phosphate synthase subunit HisH